MSTVWFVLQDHIASRWRDIGAASWERLCAKLFGFDDIDLKGASSCYRLMLNPTTYEGVRMRNDCSDLAMFGHLDGTKRLVPEPILSHRLACVALSCMQYLHRQDSNDSPMQVSLLVAWARKSKRSPWSWRQRTRVTSIGRRQTTWNSYGQAKYSFPQSLRRSHQILYSEGIQSDDFYQERRIFYMWTLDLLYHTLYKAMKSDKLTKALSKPFIPSVARILFPRRIKRVQKAVDAYLEKVSRRAFSDFRTPTDIYLYVDSSTRRV